jgi:uncharacterized LabA/DUF88 family protein
MQDRAFIFIDGNNFYHALKSAGVPDLGLLDYAKISKKLVGPREWIATRYYIGRVPQEGNLKLYSDQRRFLQSLQSSDRRITTHLGRLEFRRVQDKAAAELRRYLASLPRIDKWLFDDLMAIARNHSSTSVMIEKAVDVQLAVDMATMAERDLFDAAYLLSADGDFTPAALAVRSTGKKIYAASPAMGARLASVVNAFIPLSSEWFADCYLDS